MGRIEEALRKAKADRLKQVRPVESSRSLPEPKRALDSDGRKSVKAVSHVLPSHVMRANNDLLREQRVIAASVHDERVGAYRRLRTLLLKTMRENSLTTLAITSAHEGAGKSLTAANLAISLSRDVSTTVLLVDLDLYTPTIHEKLNFKPEVGLVDYLEGRAKLEDILFDPGIDDLMVLAGRPAGKQSSELLASPRMQSLIHDLCRQEVGNITIFDLPPLLRNDDAILFAPYADATLIVVEDGVTTDTQLQNALRLLEKANVIGTVLNKARS